VIGTGVLALYLAGANEIALLFGGGLAALAMERAGVWSRRPAAMVLLSATAAATPAVAGASGASLTVLVLTFLKIGAVLYGSGYVLLAFLRNDFVHRLGWLTDRQLLDAVAVGQFTPGPVFTTATFVGYLVGGVTGALLATGAIFLPSFVFVAASGPLLPRLRRSPAFGVLLDGVNVAALGLMAGVAWQLGRAAIVDVPTVTLAVGALLLLIRFRLNSAWLIAAGGMAGLLVRHLR
jgi:chromate transporter